MDWVLPFLYVFGLYAAYIAGFLQRKNTVAAFRFPQAMLSLLLAIGIPSTLQIFLPMLLTTLQRDPTRVLQGEWWRIITALFVQDGGIAGTVFNLLSLLLVGAVANQFWNHGEFLVLFFGGGIAGELIAFAWQPIGAGNSVGNFSLAASIAIACLMEKPPKIVKLVSLLSIGCYLVLLGFRDIHGASAIVGALLAIWLTRKRRHPDSARNAKENNVG